MQVGTIVKLKVDCLGNKAGTIGVIYEVYEIRDIKGVSAIFANGNYDGFSTVREMAKLDMTEADYFLEEVGFEPSLANYQFTNVMRLSQDFHNKMFDIVWLKEWGI